MKKKTYVNRKSIKKARWMFYEGGGLWYGFMWNKDRPAKKLKHKTSIPKIYDFKCSIKNNQISILDYVGSKYDIC